MNTSLRTVRQQHSHSRKRTLARVAAASALGLTAAAAHAAPSTVVGEGSGKCLDVNQGQNNAVQIYTCHGNANQQWELNAAGELRTLNGSLCLDARGQGTTPGTLLKAFTCNGQDNQKWRRNSNGAIVGLQSNLCVDVKCAATANQSDVQLWIGM